MSQLTQKQKLFLLIYPFIHLLMVLLLIFFGFSICMDPQDIACQEQGTLIGFLRNISMFLAGILMAPAIALLYIVKIIIKLEHFPPYGDYPFILLAGVIYGVILLIFYKKFFKSAIALSRNAVDNESS